MNRKIRYAIAASCVAASAVLFSAAASADCASSCYAQENACRRATKDSPSCGAALTRCLQSCRKR